MVHPASHGLIGHEDPTLSQQILDVAEAQGEPDIKPDHLLDDFGREAVAAIADLGHHRWLRLKVTDSKPNGDVTMPVMTLIERGGKARSFHVKNATAKTLRETAVKVASRKSYLMTDENAAYTKLGKEFDGHGTVNHSANEFARLGGFVHVNSTENYFSIFKRGVIGTYHHISEQHLDRYLAEFDFRYNNRTGLGVEDAERADKIAAGIT